VGYEAEASEQGQRLIRLEDATADLVFPHPATVLCSSRRGYAGAALPASTSSSAQHGSAAMLKPMINIPLASLRRPPEALHGRPGTVDTVAAA